jgi:putative flippase GtrA
MNKKSFLTFVKAQLSSFISTITDFSITWVLTSLIGFWYVLSSFTGTAIGGITNFMINRQWVFKTAAPKKSTQIFKYLVVWSGGITLNTLGVYFLTDILKFYYLISKVLVSVFVGVFFNYHFQNSFVFSKNV